MTNTTLCTKCKVVYREDYWIVIHDFHLHVCPECMQEIKSKIVKEFQGEIFK